MTEVAGKERSSNIELFRVCCMFGITLAHMMLHTNALESSDMYVRIWAQFFNIFSKAGVNGFVMITAWYSCCKPFKTRKIYDLYKTIWWYSAILFVLAMIVTPEMLSVNRVLKTFLPVSFDHWWFVTAFLGMLFFVPAMNLLIQKGTKYQLLYTVVAGAILMVIIPTFTAQTKYVSNLSWFCYLYMLTGFVRKYENEYKVFSLLKKNLAWILLFALIFLSTVVFTILERYIPAVREGTNFFTGMYILPLVLASLSVFLCFENAKMGYSKIINWCGHHTFPIYLIQSNTFFTVLLWNFVTELNLGATKLFPLFVVLFATLINVVFMLASVPIDWTFKQIQRVKPFHYIDGKVYTSLAKIDNLLVTSSKE